MADFDAGAPAHDLVTIRVFTDETEAEIAKGALDAFGIRCMISHDDAGGQDPFLRMVQGIRLLVRSKDVARAEQVLHPDNGI